MGNIADIIEPGGHRLTMICGRWAASGYTPAREGVEVLCSSSAGAWACLYLAAGRIVDTRPVWLALAAKDVFSFWNIFRTGHMASVNTVFDICGALAPIDFAVIDDLPVAVLVVIFRESDGAPMYELLTSANARELLGATIAIPPMSDRWLYKGESCCDGGGADPLPVRHLIDEGFEQIRVWFNREQGYTIPAYEQMMARLPWPHIPLSVRQTIVERIARHEDALRLVAHPPEGVRIKPIYPTHPSPSPRVDSDRGRVEHAWQVGLQMGHADRHLLLAP